MASEKILVVDDDQATRTIVKISLEKGGGFDVTLAASGEECLQMAGEVMPHLILMDMFMPGMDGPSAFLKLQENEVLAQIPVVFMTANTSERDTERLKTLGASGILAKPFRPSKLPSQVKEFLPDSFS